MSQFEFVAMVVAIVVAIALADGVKLWANLLQERKRVKFSGLYISLAAILPMTLILHWTGFWGYRNVEFTHPAFDTAILMSASLAMILAIALLKPDLQSKFIDLEEHYFESRQWVFGFFFLYWLLSMLPDLLLLNETWPGWYAFNGLGLGCIAAAALMTNRYVHIVSAVLLWALVAISFAAPS